MCTTTRIHEYGWKFPSRKKGKTILSDWLAWLFSFFFIGHFIVNSFDVSDKKKKAYKSFSMRRFWLRQNWKDRKYCLLFPINNGTLHFRAKKVSLVPCFAYFKTETASWTRAAAMNLFKLWCGSCGLIEVLVMSGMEWIFFISIWSSLRKQCNTVSMGGECFWYIQSTGWFFKSYYVYVSWRQHFSSTKMEKCWGCACFGRQSPKSIHFGFEIDDTITGALLDKQATHFKEEGQNYYQSELFVSLLTPKI